MFQVGWYMYSRLWRLRSGAKAVPIWPWGWRIVSHLVLKGIPGLAPAVKPAAPLLLITHVNSVRNWWRVGTASLVFLLLQVIYYEETTLPSAAKWTSLSTACFFCLFPPFSIHWKARSEDVCVTHPAGQKVLCLHWRGHARGQWGKWRFLPWVKRNIPGGVQEKG